MILKNSLDKNKIFLDIRRLFCQINVGIVVIYV